MATTNTFDHSLWCALAAQWLNDHPLLRKCQISQTGATVMAVDRWVVNTPAVNYCSSKRQPFAWRETAAIRLVFELWPDHRSIMLIAELALGMSEWGPCLVRPALADWHLALRYMPNHCFHIVNAVPIKRHLNCPVCMFHCHWSAYYQTARCVCNWLITAYL